MKLPSAYYPRKSWSRVLRSSAVALLLGGPACDPDSGAPVDPKTVALTAQANTEAVGKNLGAAASFMADSDVMAETLGKLNACPTDESCSGADPSGLTIPCVPEPTPTDCGVEGARADLKKMSADIDQGVADLVETLKTKVLVEKNIESKTETSITYRLPNDVLCEMDSAPDCAMDAAKSEPRVRVTSPVEGDIDLALLVTSSKIEVAMFHVHRNQFGVTSNLGNVYKAAKLLDTSGDFADVTKMEGVLATALVRNSDKNYSALFEVKESVHVVATDEGKPIDVRLDASNKTWELRLDGVAKTIAAAMNVGGLSIQAPIENLGDLVDSMPVMQNVKASDAMKFVLGGINGSFTFDGTTDLLKFVGLGVGNKSTSVDVNGKRVFSLDVNPASNRRFDMTVSMADTSKPVVAFSPEFTSVFGFNFDSIKDRFMELPEFLLNDTLTFKLSNQPSIRMHDNGVEVVSGTLTLTSTAHPESNISVAAGMCLVDDETPSTTGHEFLSSLMSGSCALAIKPATAPAGTMPTTPNTQR